MSDHSPKYSKRSGELIFATLFVTLSVMLLGLIGSETRYVPNAGFAVQPRFWPAVGLVMMVGCGVGHLVLTWKRANGWAVSEIMNWIRALEYLAWFMVYVTAVPILGYLASTVLFTLGLALRQGYRSAKELTAALILGVVIVLVFKTGLSVKIPGGMVYDLLPEKPRNFMMLNF